MISYNSDTIVYPSSPFDYCSSVSLPINLNQPNGADAQCALNWSSLLCGPCQPGFSILVSLSVAHTVFIVLYIASYWPAVFIAITTAAILAGIALVALYNYYCSLINMTVAVWADILYQ